MTTPSIAHSIPDVRPFFLSDQDTNSRPSLNNIKITPDDVIWAIKDSSRNAASGPDGIPSTLLHNCAKNLSLPLSIFFNKSLLEGLLPDICKSAAVIPIHKGGDKSIAANYRPISLTSVLVKIFEKIIRRSLVKYLEENNLMNDTQHGFRKGRSCISALLNVYDNILLSFNDPSVESTDMIYLDFSKAFDKVDHNIIMHKLKKFGITGQIGIWLNEFLAERTQYVQIPGGISGRAMVSSGVPQGTVLGPVLFLILISDISNNVDCNLSSFADDTRLYSQIKSRVDCVSLQSCLSTVYNWATNNNMQFNAQKFQYVCYHTKESQLTNNSYLSPTNDVIDPTQTVRDLGITMSNSCTFDVHINRVIKSCSQLVGWILRTFSSRDKLPMMTLFKAIVLPRLEYGCQLWNPYLVHDINGIEKVQRSFTKHINGLYDLSYGDRLKFLKLFSLQRRRDRYQIIYAWKILEGLVPNLQPPISVTNNARLGRMCYKLSVPTGRKGTLMYNSFRWQATRLFNSLPVHLRTITNVDVNVFKVSLDKFLLGIKDIPSQPHDNNAVHKRIEETSHVLAGRSC